MNSIEQLKLYFIDEFNSDTSDVLKYGGYADLSGTPVESLWMHATNYGYKEQRKIFYDCCYNNLFYEYYLKDYRDLVLKHNPVFNWTLYDCELNIKSEYYVLLDYISKYNLVFSSFSDITYKPPYYSIIAECASYDYEKFPFAYAAAQWSTSAFGIIIPCKSTLKRGYFMYFYDTIENYFSDEYDFNEDKVNIKLDLFINGVKSDYYVEETIDPSLNTLGFLFKKKTTNNNYIVVDYDEIIFEENTVITWYCSDLLSKNLNDKYTNYPFNPSRNRFIMILEPYDNISEILDTKQNVLIPGNNISIDENNVISSTSGGGVSNITQEDLDIKQNILIPGNNITITNNIISSIGVQGPQGPQGISGEVTLTQLNTKQNILTTDSDVSINNVTLENDLRVKGDLTLDGSFNINDGELTIPKTDGLQSALDTKQPFITETTDLSVNSLNVNNLLTGSTSGINASFDNINVNNIVPTQINGLQAIFTIAIARVNFNGVADRQVNCTTQLISTGKYRITFNTPRPDNLYIVQLTLFESVNNLDDLIITIDDNVLQTNTSFDYTIREGNGNNSGELRNRGHYVAVFDV